MEVPGGERRVVEVEYRRVESVDAGLAIFESARHDPSIVFMDGILYSATHGIMVLGRLPSSPSNTFPIVQFTRRSDPWVYLHAEKREMGRGNWCRYSTTCLDMIGAHSGWGV